jgi:flagellar motor switch protein FliM
MYTVYVETLAGQIFTKPSYLCIIGKFGGKFFINVVMVAIILSQKNSPGENFHV